MFSSTIIPSNLVSLASLWLLFAVSLANAGDPDEERGGKFHGKWQGAGPCDGLLILKSDQTYERRFYGPGGIKTSGTWSLSGSLSSKNGPTVLKLRCQSSDYADRIGKTYQWRVTKLDEKGLQLQAPATKDRKGRLVTYRRK